MLNGKRPVSVATKRKIIAKYPELNPSYVLKGEGSVLRPVVAAAHLVSAGTSAGILAEAAGQYDSGMLRGSITVHRADQMGSIRLLSGYASAGALGGDTPSGHTEGIIMVPFLPDRDGGYLGIRASGDSMAPAIRHGAVIVLPAAPTMPPLNEGAMYVIITAHICTIRRVRYTNEGYTLIPENPTHPTLTIAASDIVQAWQVVWVFQEAV